MDGQGLRPLGHLEKYSSSRHSLGFYNCIAHTCRYEVPESFREDDTAVSSAFRQALRDVILEIPALRVGINDEHTRSSTFVRVDNMRLSNHLEWRRVESMAEAEALSLVLRILEDRHQESFRNVKQQPPWRVIVVKSSTVLRTQGPTAISELHVIFAVHHSLADGISATLFHSHLVAALNKQTLSRPSSSDKEALDLVELPPTASIPPSLENVMSFPISWSFLFSTLWMEFAPSWLRGRQPSPPWTGKHVSREPNKLNIRLVQIPPLALSHILAACRAHATTLTPLIHALVLDSLASRIPAEQASSFVASTPINLRPFMNVPEIDVASQIGVYLTSQEHRFDTVTIKSFRDSSDEAAKLDAIWSAAKFVTKDLQGRRAMIPRDDKLGLLPWVGDWRARWLNMLGRPRDVTWEVSNVGSMLESSSAVITGNQEWKISQAILTQSATVAGPAFSANVAGVEGCGISISICWQDNIVATKMMNAVTQDIRHWLFSIAGPREGEMLSASGSM